MMFFPRIRSGSYAERGSKQSMEDEHICIDDVSACLRPPIRYPMPSAFYAVFDGHDGPDAALYVKKNALKLFVEDVGLPQTSDMDHIFSEELEGSYKRAFLLADLALANEPSVRNQCGTTALTALLLGRHLLVANVGDCRAVLCRRGDAIDMSQDHKPSYEPERRRVEDCGGYISSDGYVNGCLSVTRTLGDWELKFPYEPESPFIADPDVRQIVLTEDDEFLIMACDGIWDVISSQDAVSLARLQLMTHGDPQKCAEQLVKKVLSPHSDNLTVIVICFISLN